MNPRKTTAPTVTDALPTREDLERQAAQVAEQLAALRQQQEQQEQQRRARAEQEYDREQIANYSRAALDNKVAQARAQFDEALANTPLVRALADYLYAQQRRRTATYEHASALTRLGQPGIPGHDLPRANSAPLRTSSPLPCSAWSPRAPTPTPRPSPPIVRPRSPPQPRPKETDDSRCRTHSR